MTVRIDASRFAAAIEPGLQSRVEEVVTDVSRAAPVSTGRLRDGIRAEVRVGTGARIGQITMPGHARYVLSGHRQFFNARPMPIGGGVFTHKVARQPANRRWLRPLDRLGRVSIDLPEVR